MALRDNDKYSESNVAVSDMTDESCLTKFYFFIFLRFKRASVQSFASDICLVSVSISAGLFFLIPRKTLVSVNPVEKC